jgi:hypothetical protein
VSLSRWVKTRSRSEDGDTKSSLSMVEGCGGWWAPLDRLREAVIKHKWWTRVDGDKCKSVVHVKNTKKDGGPWGARL